MASKKTTLMIDEATYTEVRRRALETGSSVSNVVNEALASYLAREIRHQKVALRLPRATTSGFKLPSGVSSTAEILDLLDADLPVEKLR